MDFAGLIRSYRVNRPIFEQERVNRLDQRTRLTVAPHYQLSVIKMNSTFLESVDKWYAEKGFLTGVALAILAIFVGGGSWISSRWLLQAAGITTPSDDSSILLAYGLGTAAIFASIGLAAIWLLRKESFAYTHYPIRFNRKTRTVYVFRTNGTTMIVPWDKIFFTLAQVDHVSKYWNILGHVLKDDDSTVMESFALSVVETGTANGLLLLKSHWEFIRRFMEDGPQTLTGQVQYCLPISERKESLTMSARRLLANNSTASPLMWPIMLVSFTFYIATVPFRHFAMLTSKIPQWPEEVRTDCEIELDDPFAIEGTTHGERIAVYPKAAQSAGVRFIAPPGSPLSSTV